MPVLLLLAPVLIVLFVATGVVSFPPCCFFFLSFFFFLFLLLCLFSLLLLTFGFSSRLVFLYIERKKTSTTIPVYYSLCVSYRTSPYFAGRLVTTGPTSALVLRLVL